MTPSRWCLCDRCSTLRVEQRLSASAQLDRWLEEQQRHDELAELQQIALNYSKQDFDDGYEQGYDEGQAEAHKELDNFYQDHRDCQVECPSCGEMLDKYDENICNH